MIIMYQIYNFKHNDNSSKLHGKILEGKQPHKSEEDKKRGEVRKKITQLLLFCAKIPKTPADVQEKIKANARPQYSVL